MTNTLQLSLRQQISVTRDVFTERPGKEKYEANQSSDGDGSGWNCGTGIVQWLWPRRALTISADVDGSDVVKVSGNKLWIEHEDFNLPDRIILNDKVWVPQWTTNVSAPFEGLQPPFAPRDPGKIKVSKKAGRGTVTITQRPSAENDQTLGIRIDDNEQGGADRYTIRVSW